MSLNRKMRRQAQRASEKNANVFKRSRFNEQPENGQEDESFIKNMLGSISKSPFMKKVLLNAIGLTLMAAPAGYASDIQPVGNFTHMNINQNNNKTIYDITTDPRQYIGEAALNAFTKFDLTNGDTANFFATQQHHRVINFVQGQVNINGIVNCIQQIKNGENIVGGKLYFLSSNGVVIGSTGVVNTGSFYAIVPDEAFMNKIVKFTKENGQVYAPFEESGFLKWTANENTAYPETDGNINYNEDSAETNEKRNMLESIVYRNASGITMTGDGTIWVKNGAKINAKNNIELIAGKTYDANKADKNSVIIENGATLNTYSYETKQDFLIAALNLSPDDQEAINNKMVFYQDDHDYTQEEHFPGVGRVDPYGIKITTVGYQNNPNTAVEGYASTIKSEGTLNSAKNVEFVTTMATENATAKNAVQIAGNVTADNEFKVSGDYEYSGPDQNGSYVTTYNGDVVLGTSNKAATINSKALHIQANNISDEGTKKNIINAEGSTFQYWDHAWANFSADNNIALTNTEINTTKELGVSSKGSAKINGAIESSSVIVKSEKGIELGNITAKGLEEDHVTGKIILENNTSGEIVANKLQADGWIKDSNEQWSFQSGLGNVTVDNGNKDYKNYSNYKDLANQNVTVNEVKGNNVTIYGYDVTAKKVVANNSGNNKPDFIAGGKFTLGEDNQTAFNSNGTLYAEARSIETKGSVTAKSISLNSREGANLGGALTTTNGDINVQNYGNDSTEGDITIGGNVIARKEENEQTVNADVRINTMFNSNTATKGGKITINGEVSGKEVNIWSFGREQTSENHGDDVTLNGDVNADGMLLLAGKNVTVASGKNLNSGTSINILAKDKFDAKNSNIEAGQALSIDATDAEVKTTKSGENTQILVDGSLITHGDLKAGKELRLGKETYVGDGQNVYSNSIVLEGNTESGYSEGNDSGVTHSYSAGGDNYSTIIFGDTINAAVNQGTTIKSKGDIRMWGGTIALNNTVSLGEGNIHDSRYETEINADEITVNSITANGGVNISFTDNVTVNQKVESQTWSVNIGADRDSNFAESKATITGASAHGKIGITAGTVNLDKANAQLIVVSTNKGGKLSNLTTVNNNAGDQEASEIFGESKINDAINGNTTTVKNGIYAENYANEVITGYEEDEITPIYGTTAPTGDFTLAGTITANNGGISIYNDAKDIVVGDGNSAATITGQSLSFYTQGKIRDNAGDNKITVGGDWTAGSMTGSTYFRAIDDVTLNNTAITTNGWFSVNDTDTNGSVTIAKDINVRTAKIYANKGITVGNITANAGNITLDNTRNGIDYNTKIRRSDNWSYPDGIDEEGKFDWGSTKPTGDIVVNGNLTATIDPEDPEGKNGQLGEIEIKNGYWSSYSYDGEDTVSERNVTMKNATGRTIKINTAGTLTAGDLTSTWEEQSPTRMESRIKYKLDENGQRIKDDDGYYIYEKDKDGNYVYEDVEVENWDRTGLTVGAAEVAIGNIKSNNGVSLQNRKIAVGDVEGTNITLVANEGIEAGNITVNGTKDAYGVEISNENLYEGHYVPSEEAEEIEGGNGSLRKGSSENWSWTYTPPTGTVKVSSVKFKSRTTPTKIKKIGKIGKYAFKIKNSSLLEAPKKGEEESSSSSMYEEYKDATLDPNFKGGENGGVKVGSIEGESVQIISDNGISVGQINTEPLAEENNEQPTPAENELPAENEDYSVNLINRLTDDVVAEMIGNDFEPTLRAEPTDGSAAGSIIAKNGGVRIENQAEGGKITLGDVEGTVVYMKAKGKVSMANVTATKNGDNTFESPAVKPLYIESEGDDVVISGNIEAVGGREIKSRTGGYVTPEKEQDKPIVVPEEAPKSQEEAKQVIEDVAGEKGVEEIDRTVNGNQENTDNSSNQEVSQVNDVSSLSDMGSDNIGGFEEMGSDAGGVDVGLSEGSAEFSMGADGSFEVASVGGAEETGSGADAGTASDGGMASNDGAMAEDNTASNDGAMAEDNTAPNDGAMAEDNTASNDGAVANDNTDSDTGNGEGSNSESSAEEGNDEKGEETASVDSSEEENEENEDNDKSGRPDKGKPGKEKNGGNKKLTQFRSMLHQAKDSATQQRR